MPIKSLEELRGLASEDAVIVVKRDPKTRMASVLVAGHLFMHGNSWDCHPECHGGFHYDLARLHGAWLSSRGLAETIMRCLYAEGATSVAIVDEEYDWLAATESLPSEEDAAA